MSCIFMSCIFVLCYFMSGNFSPSVLCPAILCPVISMIRQFQVLQFHVRRFQHPRSVVPECCRQSRIDVRPTALPRTLYRLCIIANPNPNLDVSIPNELRSWLIHMDKIKVIEGHFVQIIECKQSDERSRLTAVPYPLTWSVTLLHKSQRFRLGSTVSRWSYFKNRTGHWDAACIEEEGEWGTVSPPQLTGERHSSPDGVGWSPSRVWGGATAKNESDFGAFHTQKTACDE